VGTCGCPTTYGSRVHETPETVVVDVDVRDDDVDSCTEMGKIDQIGVTLLQVRTRPGGSAAVTPSQ
jgi:hypothetical protein